MTDRQFVIEPLNGQSVNIRSGGEIVGRLTFVSSRVTGTTAGAAASLVTWAGNGQSAVAGATVTPPAVRVLDANGLPVAGSTVTWEGNTISGATQQGLTGTSDSNGVVTLGGWSVGTTAGSTYTVFAYHTNLTNSPLRFSTTPTAGSAFSLNVSAGNSQATTPFTALTSRLTTLVNDQYGNVVSGAVVTWTSTDATAAFSAATSATNASGLAGVVYTTGQSTSTATIYAALASGTSTRFGIGTIPGTPSLLATLGDGQTAISGSTLPINPTVSAADAYGNVVSGQTVDFVLVAGSGNLSRSSALLGSGGTTDVAWKLDALVGLNLLEASVRGVSGSTITFSASGTNPLADTIQIESGNSQSGTVGQALTLPLAVATLGSGSTASGQVVVFSATTGSLSTTQVTSSSTGVARTVYTLPTTAGTYTVTATANGLTGSPLQFSTTATAGNATQLVLATQPSSQPQPGVAWPQQPVVASADQYGNLVSTNTRVQCVLVSGDGTLASGVSTFAVASGATATFSGLSYFYVSVASFQVAFRCNSLSTVTASLQTSQAPFASQLVWSVQPTSTTTAGLLGSPQVTVQDALGNTVTTATNAVTVSLTASANTENGTLSGTTTRNAVSGVATFTDLSVNTLGSFTLDATATGLTGATSSAFAITALSFGTDPSSMGMTNIVNRGFNTKAAASGDRGTGSFPDKVGGSEGWDDIERNYANLSVTTDSTAPFSPSNVWQTRYQTSQTANNAPATSQTQNFTGTVHGSKQYGQWYNRVGLKLSSNYQVNATNNKLWFHRSTQLSGATSRSEPFLLLNRNGGFQLGVNFQGCPDNARTFNSGTSNGRYLSSQYLTPNRWYIIETYLKMDSSAGAGDGIFRCWVDGALVIDLNDVKIMRTNTNYWDQFHLNSTWGGPGSPSSEFYFWLDSVQCWGKA